MPSLHAVLVLLCASVPQPAHAQGDTAEQYLRRGYELRRQGETERALVQLEQAYRLDREPKTAAALGLTEAKLERWRAADRHLTQALDHTDDPWVEEHRDHLERARALVREHLDQPPGEQPERAGRETAAEPDPAPFRTPGDDATADTGTRTWTWVTLGAGAAAGVAALALRLKADAEFDRLKGECGDTRACTESDVATGRRLDRSAQAAFGLAVVGLAAAGALFFLEPAADDDRSVEVGLGPASAVVRGRF